MGRRFQIEWGARVFCDLRALVIAAACVALSACLDHSDAATAAQADAQPMLCSDIDSTPVPLPGGTFVMGSNAVYIEEGPERETTVDGFRMDPHEVTNRQFAEFVEATGYKTVAELPVDPSEFGIPVSEIPPELLEPGSAVFTPPNKTPQLDDDWWSYTPGANWKKPFGPQGPSSNGNEPVVHLAWKDMLAFAEWRGGRLPTEAEWEYAANAGGPKNTDQPGNDQANSWQGVFPVVNEESDGFAGIAPVGCYKPNAFGLYDMVGNVWEMTADYYQPGHDPKTRSNPQGPSENTIYEVQNAAIPRRVIKGGSYLCAPNYCQRYRPESRQGRDTGLGASNVGFRLVYD